MSEGPVRPWVGRGKGLALVACVLATALTGVPDGRAHAATAPRAMWLWSRADPAAVVEWATARGVEEIFAHVPSGVAAGDDLPRLRELKTLADAARIRLSALGGDPGWTFDTAAALAWQRGALATGLFSRTHVDIEPYALPAWNIDRSGTVHAFLGVLKALENDDARPLEADVPFWYGTIPVGTSTLADRVLARVGAVTVMSYRDTATGPNSLMDVGKDMLIRGQYAGKPVRLAVETEQLPDCPHCTFFEEGTASLNQVMSTVDDEAARYTAYAGLAVHHYDAWRRLA
ncbi:hypothetical protein [Spirillospora albida]|uniref:hypothetical protein n=1 Tax=Spirillospora albida TaxID=58123 RepID=UPI0012F709BA|nr:hypothetical protein [Spirillospora albida]